MGMGGAFSALADGAAALWWNPSGIVHSSFTDVLAGHTAHIESINSEAFGITRPVSIPGFPRAAIGASFTYLSIPGIEGMDANKNPTGTQSADALAGGLALALGLSSNISVGGQLKTIREKLASETGSGIAFDAGLQFRQGPLGAGLAVQHMGSAFKIANAGNPLPTVIRGGASYALLNRLTLAADMEKPSDSDAKFRYGAEARLAPALALRAGVNPQKNAGSGAGFTFGFGFQGLLGVESPSDEKTWMDRTQPEIDAALRSRGAYLVSFDYAFLSFGDFSSTHRFTLGVRF
jgi:hypothetical protein